jgi:hypothetical protein
MTSDFEKTRFHIPVNRNVRSYHFYFTQKNLLFAQFCFYGFISAFLPVFNMTSHSSMWYIVRCILDPISLLLAASNRAVHFCKVQFFVKPPVKLNRCEDITQSTLFPNTVSPALPLQTSSIMGEKRCSRKCLTQTKTLNPA